MAKASSTRDRARRLDCFRRHLELGVFAGELRVHVVAGKGDLHLPRLARGHADELIFEARNEGPGSDIDADIAAGAALERHALERAGEVDDDPIALFDLAALPLGRERPVLLGDPVERFADLGVGHFRHRTLELDALEIGELDLRQHLDRQRIGEVGLPADDLLDLGLLVRDRDLGLHGELETMIGDDLGVELANQRLDGLGHHGLAVDLLEVRHRHLARPEAAQLHLVLEFAQALGEPRLEIGGRHLDLKFALEAVGESFCDFHDDNLHVLAASAAAMPWT